MHASSRSQRGVIRLKCKDEESRIVWSERLCGPGSVTHTPQLGMAIEITYHDGTAAVEQQVNDTKRHCHVDWRGGVREDENGVVTDAQGLAPHLAITWRLGFDWNRR